MELKHIKHLLLSLILLLTAVPAVNAQDGNNSNKPDRKEWFRQMRQFKHKFLIKELSLTQQQQNEFFPVYDSMQDEIEKLQRTTMQACRKVSRAKKAVSDAEYLHAARQATEQKAREGAIEELYFDKFTQILTPEQMFRLHSAERKFTREIMRQHNKMAERRKHR